MGGIRTGTGKGRGRCKQGGQQREEDKTSYVGKGCAGVLGGIHGGGCRYDLGPIIFVMAITEDYSRPCKVCHRQICTWEYFKRPS